MNSAFRIARPLLAKIQKDLSRKHAHAHERVGFIACRTASVDDGTLLLAHEYLPVDDADYEYSRRVGAMMSSDAIRKALQHAYQNNVAMMHVHRHEHRGTPGFSQIDLVESAKFVPDFWKVRPGQPHGTLVLSHDSMCGLAWSPETRKPCAIAQMSVVGSPLSIFGRWWR